MSQTEQKLVFILCNDYKIAQETYESFRDYSMWMDVPIIFYNDGGLCIQTEDNPMCIFIDEHFWKIISDDLDDKVTMYIIDCDTFQEWLLYSQTSVSFA